MAAKVKIQKIKKPSEIFFDLMKILRFCADTCGVDVVDPNYRINYRTRLCSSAGVIYFIFTGMTVKKLFADNWKVLLEATCMAGSVVQCITKLISGIAKAKIAENIHHLLTIIYEKYEKLDERYVVALKNNLRIQRRLIVIIGVGYALCACTMIILPVLITALTGSRMQIIHFQLPGLDLNTNFGYFTTCVTQIFVLVFGAFGLFVSDGFIITYMLQTCMFDDIFRLKVEDVNELVRDGVNEGNEQKVNESLRDIVQWHQLYTQFTAKCNDLFSEMITMQVLTSVVGIVLTIYILLTSTWPSAYIYFLVVIYNLYVCCVLGTITEKTNDNFSYEIYNIAWYNMRVSQQKMVRLMLMNSQSPAMIQIAGVLPLSVSTGLQITKTIYTITMFMIEFLID